MNNKAAATVPEKKPQTARDIVDLVATKIRGFMQSGQLDLPSNYSVENALKSAWLTLQTVKDKDQKPALEVCTKTSLANSLLDMIIQGLNPAKKQGYFIVYGKQLVFQRSYFGSMAVLQTINQAVGDFAYAVVYEDDKFKYGIKDGRKTILLHEQDINNIDKKRIKGAYCIIFNKVGEPIKTEIMTMAEVMQSWKQSKQKPFNDSGELREDSVHGRFTADMALKTVINKACKILINASSDNALLLERINRAEDFADQAGAQAEIEEHANTGETLQIEESSGESEEPKGPDIPFCPDGGEASPEKCIECPSKETCRASVVKGKVPAETKAGRKPGF